MQLEVRSILFIVWTTFNQVTALSSKHALYVIGFPSILHPASIHEKFKTLSMAGSDINY